MKYNKLFEELEPKEQKAVKFAFDLVATNNVYGCKLVKLNANGSTGYPVYYLYMRDKGQGYVLRILKQGRKCKLMPFGNPKLIWTFVGETSAKMPKRTEATVECFTKIFSSNTAVATSIINWINRTLQSNLTLQDFGVISNTSKYQSTRTSSTSTSSSKPVTKPVKDEKDKKIALFKKLVKKEFDEHKKRKDGVIIINIADLYYNNRKDCKKYWDEEEKFEEDAYRYNMYSIDFSGYTREQNIVRPSGWLRHERPSFVESIKYIGKTCKEFDSLNKYIQNTLKCKPLKTMDVYKRYVHGKRDDIFEVYSMNLLAHNEKRCKAYKAALQKMRKANWKASINIKHNWDRDEWSYREECEWEGEETYYALIRFTTPSGKQVAEYELWP